ncbi:hypothetical protein D3C79_1050040 [compost metagenome]
MEFVHHIRLQTDAGQIVAPHPSYRDYPKLPARVCGCTTVILVDEAVGTMQSGINIVW